MRRGLFRGLGLVLIGVAVSCGTAHGAAWQPSATIAGEFGGAAMNARGDVALVASHDAWPAPRTSRLHVRPAGGRFTATTLPASPHVASLALSDSGELVLPMSAGGDRDTQPHISTLHRAPGGRVTVQQHPGLVDLQVALREDGLGVLLARRTDGQAVVAWKDPGQAAFGEPKPAGEVETVDPGTMTLPEFLRPQPGVGFTDGVAVMALAQGEVMQVRAAKPHGTFGAPVRIGPATDRSEAPRLSGRDGHMVASWDSGSLFPLHNVLYASVKAPGQGFGPASQVGQGINLKFPPIGISRSGHLVAVWTAGNPNMRPGEFMFRQNAAERRSGKDTFRPVAVPRELAGAAGQAQFDSQGAAVLAGGSNEALDPTGKVPGPKAGLWTWSRAADGTLAGPDLISMDARGGSFLLNGRGRGVAFGREVDRVLLYDYDEAASMGRVPPVVSSLAVGRRIRLRSTKTARVRLRFEQLGRAGVVRARCAGKAGKRGASCKRRRAMAGWRSAEVGANTLTPSKTTRRFLARPGRYRVTARARDSRGRYGRAHSVRLRVRR